MVKAVGTGAKIAFIPFLSQLVGEKFAYQGDNILNLLSINKQDKRTKNALESVFSTKIAS